MNQQQKDKLSDFLIIKGQAYAAVGSTDGKILSFDAKTVEVMFTEYETIKDGVKALITSQNFLADGHKIGTFFLSSILKIKPIIIVKTPHETHKDELALMANYNFGIITAFYIIRMFYEDANDGKELTLRFPVVSTASPYQEQLYALIKEISRHINQKDSQLVLLMAVSHIFFLLEKISERID